MKPETVYAYVSRGQLSSRRDPGGRGQHLRRPRGGGARPAQQAGRSGESEHRRRAVRRAPASRSSTATGTTSEASTPTELAARHSYEEVAEWLWTGTAAPRRHVHRSRASVAAARRAVDALPEHSGPMDRLRVAAIAAAAADPLRFDLSRERRARHRAQPSSRRSSPPCPRSAARHRDEGPLAQRLWARLTGRSPTGRRCAALDTALGLLVDHDLAASTLAVRVAASARAHPYAAVSAGLGVLEGPLHGAASGLAHRMLLDVLDQGSAAPVVADELRAGRRVPGLGHRLYPGEDPRARALFALLEEVPRRGARPGGGPDVVATTARHAPLHANVDLALAVLTVASGMSASPGRRSSPSPGQRDGSPTPWRSTRNARCGCARAALRGSPSRPAADRSLPRRSLRRCRGAPAFQATAGQSPAP